MASNPPLMKKPTVPLAESFITGEQSLLREPRVVFNIRLPASVHARLMWASNNISPAKGGGSMHSIALKAIFNHLDELIE